MGWGPGVTLYTIFAVLAGYSGYLLYEIFLGLDSYEYPVRDFGDLGYRLLGPWMRYLFNFLQAVQLLILVGLNIMMSGESLSQAARFQLCFIVCCVLCAVVGMAAGQIRTLQKIGWLANAAVWANIVLVLVTMGAVANYPPNYTGSGASAGAVIDGGAPVRPDANGSYPPVTTSGGLPHSDSFAGSVSGVMQAVFAYGGCMLFPEFMAEMKRPKDFLSAMVSRMARYYSTKTDVTSGRRKPSSTSGEWTEVRGQGVPELLTPPGTCSMASLSTGFRGSTRSTRAIWASASTDCRSRPTSLP